MNHGSKLSPFLLPFIKNHCLRWPHGCIICSEFCSVVKKALIYTTDEVKKLIPKMKLPVNEIKANKPNSDAAAAKFDDRSSAAGSGC